MFRNVQKYIPSNPIHTEKQTAISQTNTTKKSQVESPQVPKKRQKSRPWTPWPIGGNQQTSSSGSRASGGLSASSSPPLWGVQSCFPSFFFAFGFLIFWLFFFGSLLLKGWQNKKKVAGHNSLSLCFGSVVSLENHEQKHRKKNGIMGEGEAYGTWTGQFCLWFIVQQLLKDYAKKHRQPMSF